MNIFSIKITITVPWNNYNNKIKMQIHYFELNLYLTFKRTFKYSLYIIVRKLIFTMDILLCRKLV